MSPGFGGALLRGTCGSDCWILTSGTQVVPAWSRADVASWNPHPWHHAAIPTRGIVQREALICFVYPISPHPVGIYSLPQSHDHCFHHEHFPWQQLRGFHSLKELEALSALPQRDLAVTPGATGSGKPILKSPKLSSLSSGSATSRISRDFSCQKPR